MFSLQEERPAPTTVLSTMLLSPELWPLNQSKGINRFSSYFHSYNLRFKLFGPDLINMTIMDTFSGRSRHRSLPDLQRNQSPRSTRSAPWERDADT